MQKTTIQRKYKDRLFRMAFREKEHLLALYNAVNGSHYHDPELLEIRTLEDVIYMGVKNDASFLLDDTLNLWEHQSSKNPNMPLRALSYFSRLYQAYIQEHGLNIYSSTLQHVPFPQYIVFYNGTRREPDRTELHLSDAFIRSDAIPDERRPCLELHALMLNINWGHNRELMEHCRRLREYSQCVATIRDYEKRFPKREEAVAMAVDYCISQGFLADILSKNKSEVIALFLTEYDEKAQRALDRRDARREGMARGLEKGRKQGCERGMRLKTIHIAGKKLKKGSSAEDTADMLEESVELIQEVYAAFQSHPDWTDEEIYQELFGTDTEENDDVNDEDDEDDYDEDGSFDHP